MSYNGYGDHRGSKRGADDDRSRSETRESREDRRRKKKSRWSENDRVVIPGMPTTLPPGLTPEQERIYLLQLQIEEISRRLRIGDLGIPANPEERSPSPEPIYNSEGKRLNTREYRTRKKLEEERHAHVLQMNALNPLYKPPSDYKAPQAKMCEKVVIPQEEHPDINFVGLLIGPRGNTLKSMEKDSGSKIIIRGKGSVKEGKIGRKDGQPMPGEDEPLHAFVTGPSIEAVKKAVGRIMDIIRQGIEIPENQNDLRRNQLRELALLNGTLRENDGPKCNNCGSSTHRSWQCPDKPNVTNNVTCNNCGGIGHISRDCKEKRGGHLTGANTQKIDEEYLSLMAELGEAPPPSSQKSSSASVGTYQVLAPRNLDAPKALAAPPSSSTNQSEGSSSSSPASDVYSAYAWSGYPASSTDSSSSYPQYGQSSWYQTDQSSWNGQTAGWYGSGLPSGLPAGLPPPPPPPPSS